MKIFFLFFYLLTLCLSFAEERKYYEEWYYSGVKINFGILNNKEPFPYHPSQKEFNKARSEGAFADITVKVIDEYGHPVENAKVSFLFQMDSLGYTGKPDNDYLILTDSNGCAHANSKCDGILSLDVSKDKWYYTGLTTMCFFYFNNISLQDGKWQPYGMTHTIVMRPIKNQIRMYRPELDFHSDFPKKGAPIGLDFFACDWVAPYGKGETADLLLQYDINENENEKTETLTFSFPNQGDGIYRKPSFKGSTYREDYNASEDPSQYNRQMVFWLKSKFFISDSAWAMGEKCERLVSENDIDYKDFLVLRTRTALDENGRIKSCHYSKIVRQIRFSGGHLELRWLTNPTPCDTNLEEDSANRYTLEKARAEAKKRAELEQAQATVSKTVADFLDVLKSGEQEEAFSFYNPWFYGQHQYIRQWFSRTSPKFVSGELEAQIEKQSFVFENSAIVPVRIWKSGHPDDFEHKAVCLIRRSNKWGILTNSENIHDNLNGLNAGMARGFKRLFPLYEEYKKTCLKDGPFPLTKDVNQSTTKPQEAVVPQQSSGKPQESEPIADKATAEAVSKVVNDFVEALKAGDKGKAMGLFDARGDGQRQHVEKWLSKAFPFFMSGNVQTAAEPVCFALGDAAVLPARQWRTDRPERFEIEITCLVKRDGRWLLPADFENAWADVNGLDQRTLKDFERLREAFMNYKGKKKAEMKR